MAGVAAFDQRPVREQSADCGDEIERCDFLDRDQFRVHPLALEVGESKKPPVGESEMNGSGAS